MTDTWIVSQDHSLRALLHDLIQPFTSLKEIDHELAYSCKLCALLVPTVGRDQHRESFSQVLWITHHLLAMHERRSLKIPGNKPDRDPFRSNVSTGPDQRDMLHDLLHWYGSPIRIVNSGITYYRVCKLCGLPGEPWATRDYGNAAFLVHLLRDHYRTN